MATAVGPKRIKLPLFVEMLRDLRVCRAVSFVAETDPKNSLLKTGNRWWDASIKQWKIYKRSYVNGLINWQYENAVNNQRDREGQPIVPGTRPPAVEIFTANPRSWGARLEGQPFVEHKGELYLEVKVQAALGYEYYTLLADKKVDKEAVNAYLADRSESSRQQVDRPVILRDYNVRALKQFTLNGTTYQIA